MRPQMESVRQVPRFDQGRNAKNIIRLVINADGESRPVALDQAAHAKQRIGLRALNVEFHQCDALVAQNLVRAQNDRPIAAAFRQRARRAEAARKRKRLRSRTQATRKKRCSQMRMFLLKISLQLIEIRQVRLPAVIAFDFKPSRGKRFQCLPNAGASVKQVNRLRPARQIARSVLAIELRPRVRLQLAPQSKPKNPAINFAARFVIPESRRP